MDAFMDRTDTPLRSVAGRELVPILQSVANGDRAALSQLYRRTSSKLYGICSRLLDNQAEAEDVLQEVYMTVWGKASSFDEQKASPVTWLAVIARNKAIDRLRLRRPGTETLDAAEQVADDRASAVDLIERDQETRRLSSCLDELEERQQHSIRAAFLDGATYPQLAEREGVPLGTMKSWIRRGLLRLKGCLER
jgi:RNA polymerase sigma-70 factor (ECF subfamily)